MKNSFSKQKRIICLSSMGKNIDGSVQDENLRNFRTRTFLDTDDGKCIFIEFQTDTTAKEPLSNLVLTAAEIHTDNNYPESLLRYVSTSDRGGSINLLYNGKSLGRHCQNNKENICNYINDTFNCSYDGAEILPMWAKRRESKNEPSILYDKEYYNEMDRIITQIETEYKAVFYERTESEKHNHIHKYPTPISVWEKERGKVAIHLGNGVEELSKHGIDVKDNDGRLFTININENNFMDNVPFHKEYLKKIKDNAVDISHGINVEKTFENITAKEKTKLEKNIDTGISR